jgi:hypothetical protein
MSAIQQHIMSVGITLRTIASHSGSVCLNAMKTIAESKPMIKSSRDAPFFVMNPPFERPAQAASCFIS